MIFVPLAYRRGSRIQQVIDWCSFAWLVFVSLICDTLHFPFSHDYHFCSFQVIVVCQSMLRHVQKWPVWRDLFVRGVTLSMHPMMKRSTAQDFKSHVHTTLTEGQQNTNKYIWFLAGATERFWKHILRKANHIETHCACASKAENNIQYFFGLVSILTKNYE